VNLRVVDVAKSFGINGEPGGNRTHNPQIKRRHSIKADHSRPAFPGIRCTTLHTIEAVVGRSFSGATLWTAEWGLSRPLLKFRRRLGCLVGSSNMAHHVDDGTARIDHEESSDTHCRLASRSFDLTSGTIRLTLIWPTPFSNGHEIVDVDVIFRVTLTFYATSSTDTVMPSC